MPQSEKLTHKAAAYRELGTATVHCAVCSMYRNPDDCTLVEDIKWHGTCKYFERRKPA